MLRAAIFDFDGTVADTIPVIRKALNLTMQRFGFSSLTHEQVVQAINNGARTLVRDVLPPQLRVNDAEVDRIFAVYLGDYRSCHLDTKVAYDGIPALFEALHRDGWKLAVLSNKHHDMVENLSRQTLPKGTVDTVQGVISEKPTKPDPYLVNLVCERLGVRPEECVMIGDSDVDVLTAQNAGMQHIGVTWGYRSEEILRQRGATRFAHNAIELECLLRQMKKENEEC
ncbi:MAG: HAD family hydrolase [Clostridia bacterium]|nr:HAD family hydrolase [Clostridia bacterium]